MLLIIYASVYSSSLFVLTLRVFGLWTCFVTFPCILSMQMYIAFIDCYNFFHNLFLGEKFNGAQEIRVIYKYSVRNWKISFFFVDEKEEKNTQREWERKRELQKPQFYTSFIRKFTKSNQSVQVHWIRDPFILDSIFALVLSGAIQTAKKKQHVFCLISVSFSFIFVLSVCARCTYVNRNIFSQKDCVIQLSL